MRDKHRPALGRSREWAPLVALILTLVFAVIVALTSAVGVALSENAPAPPQSGSREQPFGDAGLAPAMTILNTHEVESILGREVLSAANEYGPHRRRACRRGGLVRAAIIDFGGFLASQPQNRGRLECAAFPVGR